MTTSNALLDAFLEAKPKYAAVMDPSQKNVPKSLAIDMVGAFVRWVLANTDISAVVVATVLVDIIRELNELCMTEEDAPPTPRRRIRKRRQRDRGEVSSSTC
jgi:hypothetical protein